MSYQILQENGGRNLLIHVRGKLAKTDYKDFSQEFEQNVRHHGKLGVLFDMTGFHGWKPSALWDEIKFNAHHRVDVDRLAMVGDKKWQHGLALFCKPFTSTPIQYFNQGDLADARTWLNGSGF
jgi:hypothetical protein